MPKYNFRKYQPLPLRLWHWLNAAVIFGLLGTVLLRKTFLSWRTNSALIEAKLKEAGTVITPELAKDIAVSIRNPLWDWHIYLGFGLAALLVGRVLVAAFVEKKCPLGHALESFKGLKNVPPQEKPAALHYTLVRAGYAVFYFVTLLMVATGLMQTFKTELGLSKDFIGTVKEVHELMMWFFVIFVGGHITGVVIAENQKDPGIISDMIHGGDRPQK